MNFAVSYGDKSPSFVDCLHSLVRTFWNGHIWTFRVRRVSLYISNQPTSSLRPGEKKLLPRPGRLPQTQLIGRRREANTCRFIINTCCAITDTCFRPHRLYHGDRIECNEWINARLHLRHRRLRRPRATSGKKTHSCG